MQSMRDLIESFHEAKSPWETLDTTALLKRKEEQTTSANVGAYETPFGPMLRPAFPHPEGVLGDYEELLRRIAQKKVKKKS